MITLQHSFTTGEDRQILTSRAMEFYRQGGYQPVDGIGQLKYQRGSRAKSIFTYNPKDFPVMLELSLFTNPDATTTVAMCYDLDVTGEAFTFTAAEVYWKAEMQACQAAMLTANVQTDHLAGVAKASQAQRDVMTAGLPIENPVSSPLISPSVKDVSTQLRRSLRSWGIWLGIIGLYSLITTGVLSSSWDVILILVALGSLFFRTPAIYIIYGIAILSSGISNLTGRTTFWIIIALIQVYLEVLIFIRFRRFNKAYLAGRAAQVNPQLTAPAEVGVETAPQPAVEILPQDPAAPFLSWISLGLGVLSATGFLATFVLLIALNNTPLKTQWEGGLYFTADLAVNLGLLGFAGGLGCLLSRHRFKGAAIVGMLGGGLTLLIYVGLIVFSKLS